MDTAMRAARQRLLSRTAQLDRAYEAAARRREDGPMPAVREADAGRRWTAWIAARPEDR